MKYIRIKDDIAICSIELDGVYYCSIYDNPQLSNKEYQRIYNCQIAKGSEIILNGDFYCIYKSSIIKQAENIEELFSAFVLKGIDLIHLNEEYTQYRFEGSDEWFDIIDTEIRMGIYGAIWTDKGLIYVAKMNDKKEFELL